VASQTQETHKKQRQAAQERPRRDVQRRGWGRGYVWRRIRPTSGGWSGWISGSWFRRSIAACVQMYQPAQPAARHNGAVSAASCALALAGRCGLNEVHLPPSITATDLARMSSPYVHNILLTPGVPAARLALSLTLDEDEQVLINTSSLDQRCSHTSDVHLVAHTRRPEWQVLSCSASITRN
jgi:hypothetical protein